MKTNVNKIFDEIIKNLDLIKIESFESYKDVKILSCLNFVSSLYLDKSAFLNASVYFIYFCSISCMLSK